MSVRLSAFFGYDSNITFIFCTFPRLYFYSSTADSKNHHWSCILKIPDVHNFSIDVNPLHHEKEASKSSRVEILLCSMKANLPCGKEGDKPNNDGD